MVGIIRRRLIFSVLLAVFAGMAEARGPWRASEGNSAGWQFMSPEERIEHQARIRGFRTYDDCQAYRQQHHALMEERARAAGQTLRHGRDFCAHLRAGVAEP